MGTTIDETTPAEHVEHAGPLSNHWRQAMLIIAGATLLRLALAALVPLVPDEAYYWDWSRRLAGGYFDHPPMIAWLIAGGRVLLGDTPVGVRLLPILCGGLGAYFVALTACRLGGESSARFVALVVSIIPLSAAGLVVATPDAPLFAFIAATMYCLVRAIEPDQPATYSLRWWCLAGVAIGLAMASKFTAVLAPMAVTLALAIHPDLRGQFRRPGPWAAVAIASVVMIPVMFWNAQHDWIAFRFQLGHGLGQTASGNPLARELELIGGQLGLVTPILCVLLVGAIVRTLSFKVDATRFLLATLAAVTIAFFVFSALRKPVEANWPAAGWLPAMVLLAIARPTARSAWERRGVWLAGALSAIVVVHAAMPFLPLPASRDPVARGHGWKAVAEEVEVRGQVLFDVTPELHLAANRYQDAAMLSFHMDDHPAVYALNVRSRRNQYDLWPRFRDNARPGASLVLLAAGPDSEQMPAPVVALSRHFLEVRVISRVPLKRGDETYGARNIYFLVGWLGTWPADPNDPRP
jgi:4-amino-4-deoxy-L-arabinose transferase-like glycosyltransferase